MPNPIWGFKISRGRVAVAVVVALGAAGVAIAIGVFHQDRLSRFIQTRQADTTS